MNPVEEKLYEIAGKEIASKNVKLGLWTKAFTVAEGDEQRTKVGYIKLRVGELREQFAAEFARQCETESQRIRREEALIRERFSRIPRLPYSDTDHIPRELFAGSPSQLRCPVSAVRVAQITGLLHFEVADLIKRGCIKGVYDGTEWYCDVEAGD